MSKNLFFGLMVVALVGLLWGGEASASGGVVKFKTGGSIGGYYYNANGSGRARYCAYYNAGEFDGQAVICGIRTRPLDQSSVTPGVDDYILGGDVRSVDANHPGYADLSSAGLIALADVNSLVSCSRTAAPTTYTFGGGAGVPDPLTAFLLTMQQPKNNNPLEGLDFCGICLDTTSVFANAARTQSYSVADPPIHASIGFNHYVEAIVLEPKFQDLNIRMTGSSRFPGDRGLPVMFARRVCDSDQFNCVVETGDSPVSTSDDFITARITIDNNTATAISANLTIEADRSRINPKLGLTDVTPLFRSCGGGGPIMNPLTLPALSRTNLCFEIKTAIKRRFLGSLPVDLPFVIRANEATLGTLLDTEPRLLGLRQCAGYYDSDSHDAFFFSRTPVCTGDALMVRYDAIDLQNRDNHPVTYRTAGAQIVGGEFGASGLAGLDAVEVRAEDPILAGVPDLAPTGLLRTVSAVGDPGNGDGIPFGPPATTVNVDFTEIVMIPGDFALATNLFAMAYLQPGDTAASVTAIGSAAGGDVFVGNSSLLHPFFGTLVSRFTEHDHEIRLDHGGELGRPIGLRDGRKTKIVKRAVLRRFGEYIALDDDGSRIE